MLLIKVIVNVFT